MNRLLYVEDQDDFAAATMKQVRGNFDITRYGGEGLDTTVHPDGSKPIEQQIARQIQTMEFAGGEFSAVLLDTDLSRLRNGVSQSSMRTACSSLGLPVLRYSRKGLTTAQERMKYLATIAREGSQSILVPDNVLQGSLGNWLNHIMDGFWKIREALDGDIKRGRLMSPPEVVARIVGVDDLDIDLMGYSGANFFFFGDLLEFKEGGKGARNFSTQLGYWLVNYVLMFPGPIMNAGATAAYLSLPKSTVETPEFADVFKSAQYTGPFGGTGKFYVRKKLDERLGCAGSISFRQELVKKGVLSEKDDAGSHVWYYCVVNDEPVREDEAKGPVEWIPRGADMCRVKSDTYEKFGPWLNV